MFIVDFPFKDKVESYNNMNVYAGVENVDEWMYRNFKIIFLTMSLAYWVVWSRM